MFTLICVFVALLSFATCDDQPRVTIEQGTLQGKYSTSRKGRSFSSFTGIPYAKPPIGDLRFKEPEPADSWPDVFDATKSHPVCPQLYIFFGNNAPIGNEDCLFLNVYTPKTDATNLPVLFYIHGGGFVFWSAKPELFGPELLLDKDVILVTVNYRLGPLGFFSTGDDVVPGNNGLKDQVLAMKWVKKNIAKFGGDPNKITIFGESAGGGCVHLHTVSPLSKNLIAGAIAQSGTAMNPWSVDLNGLTIRNSKKIAELMNCTTETNQKMIQCLRKVDAFAFFPQLHHFHEWNTDPIVSFLPVIEGNGEGAFLTEDPISLYKSGKAANIPFMTGITTEEGALQAPMFFKSPQLLEELNKDFNKIAPITFLYKSYIPEGDTKASEEILKYYFNGKITNTSQKAMVNLYTDSMFLNGAESAVRLHVKYTKQPTYYYLFGYRGSISFGDVFGGGKYDYGVCHCDDLLYLFKMDDIFADRKFTEDDEKVTDIMLSLWTNFAKTGNPTPETTPEIPVKWEPVEEGKIKMYLIKNKDNIRVVENVFEERVNFWNNLPIQFGGYHVSKEI